jgi:DNA repair ATPase RecN
MMAFDILGEYGRLEIRANDFVSKLVKATLIATIFLLPIIVGEMNSGQEETQSAYDPDVCSDLHNMLAQSSAEYQQRVAEYDQKTAEYASALFEYNKELPPAPSHTGQIQEMYNELQQIYKDLTNLETQVNTLTMQYNNQCVT